MRHADPRTVPAPQKESPSKRSSTTLRAGALRFERSQSDSYSIIYESDRGLRIAGLQTALGKRRLAARVSPFTQKNETGAIEHGGEIVALAVAAQLKTIGWLVDLASPEQMRKAARKAIEEADLSGALATLDISGRVTFTARSKGELVVARLDGDVTFREPGSGDKTVSAVAEAQEPLKSGSRSDALEKTSKRALHDFVRQIITSSKLGPWLVSLVKAKR